MGDGTLRRAALVATAAVLLGTVVGCGGGSGGGGVIAPAGVEAAFTESGTAAAANLVRMTGAPADDLVTVDLVIDGPTTSGDLYAFAFDVVLGNPSVAEFVAGSATFGDALTVSGGQSPSVLATQNGDRVTIGVSKLGGGSGNGIAAGQRVVVSLDFRLLRTGSSSLTLVGSPPNDPAALDSTGSEIGSVVFDGASATLVGV